MSIAVHNNNVYLQKSLLWVGLLSIIMFFAGMTSAVVVSKTSGIWVSYTIPKVFLLSTFLIVISSFMYHVGYKMVQKGDFGMAKVFFAVTGILGVAFISMQFYGWNRLVAQGIFATGIDSSVSASYFYLIVFLHLLHFAAAMISWSVVTIKTFNGKYTENTSKIGVSTIFWHFLTILWVYVFFFMQYMING
jgi:cytochrome c oxidase subunit 3